MLNWGVWDKVNRMERKIDSYLPEIPLSTIEPEIESIDVTKWTLDNFYIPELNGPIELYPYQLAALKEACSKNEDGTFKYNIVVWSDIKKSAKCVHSDTLILKSNGDCEKASNILVGDEIISYNGKCLITSKVKGVEWQPEETIYKIITKRGRVIKVSGEHPFLVYGDKRPVSLNNWTERSFYKWVKAKDLEIKDKIEVALDWAEDKECDSLNFYLLGAYIGDGGFGVITTTSPGILAEFKKRFETTERGKYGYYLLDSASWLQKYGLLKGPTSKRRYANSHTKRVPKEIFSAGKKAIAEFLSGYIDTDGTVANKKSKQPNVIIGSVNKELLQDCQILFAAIGFNATLTKQFTRYKGEKVTCYGLGVYGRKQVFELEKILHLREKRKSERLSYWANEYHSSKHVSDTYSGDRIVSIEKLPKEKTIAIEVNNTHTHITNGFITHNSCLAAAVALYRAYFLQWGSIKIVANDLKQADSRVAYYLRRAIKLNPNLKHMVKQVSYKSIFPNDTIIEAIPIDPSGESGGNDDMIIFSELWAAKNKAIKQMWTELTLSPTKFGYSQRWVETYAGYAGESPILEDLYDKGVKEGTKLDLSSDEYGDLSNLEVYANDTLFCLWNTQPRLPWQTDAYYDSEKQVLTTNEFERIHRNRWMSSVEKFVDKIWWANCKEDVPPLTKDEPLIIALDANKGSQSMAPTDCFAMVMVGRNPNNKEKVAIRYCGIWNAEKGQLMDYNPIIAELKRLCSTYSIVEICYDPFQLHYICSTLKKEGVGNFKEFNQGVDRLRSDKLLRDLIIQKKINHDGNPLLAQHIDNADIKNHGEDGIRIVKRNQKSKVDAAVALSMAAARCLYYNLG